MPAHVDARTWPLLFFLISVSTWRRRHHSARSSSRARGHVPHGTRRRPRSRSTSPARRSSARYVASSAPQTNPRIPQSAQQNRASEKAEIDQLQTRLSTPIERPDLLRLFAELPISKRTLEGLGAASWVEMTEIQRGALPLALAGKDVLGAAKTGSGKTLSFIIPVLETLYRLQWTPMDGLGALVISPTRELALQIFDVLKKAGSKHSFSAGLVIGGKDVKEERDRLVRMNILVCTPGRLLQHMDETPNFDCSNLRLLVLDEADRILDMGFEANVNAIIENLPKARQTLLFSATQTKSVRDLARLSLKARETQLFSLSTYSTKKKKKLK